MTDRRRLAAGPADPARGCRCLVAQVRHAIEAGIDIVQVRERDLEAGALVAVVAELSAAARGTGCRIVVNDRVDVAIAGGAAGVHLRGDSPPAALVRAIAPPGFLIGCSVHSMAEAMAAADADYLVAGTVWPTGSKTPGSPLLGVAGLAAIARTVRVPVLAIGGVTLDRIDEVARSGAAGVAAIGLFIPSTSSGVADGCRAAPLDAIVRAARQRFDSSATPS